MNRRDDRQPPLPEDDGGILQGGGRMAELIRAVDWSSTPLGPMARWPQSLRTTVSTCLSSRFPIVVWWGRDFVKIYNDAYMQLLGSKHPRALGAPGREVWPEIWHIIGPMLEGVMREGAATWSENQLLELERHGFAEECYFTFSYSPVRDESGGVGGVFCAVTETTAQVIGERRLRLLQELAAGASQAETAEQACRIAAGSLDGAGQDLLFALLYLYDDGGGARLAGAAGLALSAELAPAYIAAGDPAPAWPLDALRLEREPRLVTPRPGMPAPALLLPIAAAGGAAAGVLVAGLSPRLMLDERYRGFLGLVAGHVGTAIAHARAFEQEKRRAEALAELDRAKTVFFSNVSHELRTPLTLLLGPTEDALGSGQPLAGELLRVVHHNGRRLLKLVNTLLDFARIESGRARAAYRPTDLAALTRDVASTFRSAIERAGLRFEVDCEALPWPVFVDRDMWEKIVLNLLSNALKFTFAGELRVALRARDGCAELEVRDSGTGIPAAQLPHVFTRFHRIEGAPARTHEGSGIGLALVKELVTMQGGTIDVASTPGRGTTFTVCMPSGTAHLRGEPIGAGEQHERVPRTAAPYVEEALGWLGAQGETPDGAEPLPGEARILVADDNADMRDYLRRLLAPRWSVETAVNGATALAAARERPPDLVLTDVMMPGLDGFGLLRELRADPRTRAVPVLMLSARAGEEAQLEGLGAGADDYLVKPFSARELIGRVAAQVAAGRARAAEHDQARRLRELFAQAPVAIALLRGPEHELVFANQRYEALAGGRVLQGRPLLDALPELAGQGIRERLDEVRRTGRVYVGREHRVVLPRGAPEADREGWFNVVVQPILRDGRDVDESLIVAVEVTDEVRARQRLEQLTVELERASRAKDEFLAMLGHELRNPLAPILTAVQLLPLRGGGAVERERLVIERQTRHLVRLVDDLLDVSRIAGGKIELRKERIELADVVARGIEQASPLLEQRTHSLRVAVPRAGLPIHGDPTRLAQVVGNLLTNAAKYTEPGGEIVVSGARDGDRVVLSVRDSGIGIAPEMLPHIFDLFVQGRQSIDRSQGGLGLGLTIVRSLVALHGGTVVAESEGARRGSEFRVVLPVAAPLPVAAASPQPHAAAAQAGKRVLLVDDNVAAAEMMAEALQALGHEVAVAHDAPAALRIAGSARPEVALLDIGLPVIDGYELAARLRDESGSAAIRFFALTGYGQDADRERSLQAGFEAHFVKPIDLAILDAALRR